VGFSKDCKYNSEVTSRSSDCQYGQKVKSMLKADKKPSEILAVLVNAVILGLDVLLLQESDDGLLQLSAALAWNDLYQGNAFLHRLIDHAVQFRINLLAFVEDLMKVEHQLCHVTKVRSDATKTTCVAITQEMMFLPRFSDCLFGITGSRFHLFCCLNA